MIIKDHTQLRDDDYERQFKRCLFKPVLFTHEAHIRLAYIHITKYGASQAEKNLIKQIKAYAEYYGAFEKFNIKVTVAAVKTLNYFIQKSYSTNFQDLMREFPQILSNFKGILRQHYSYNVFGDIEAKMTYKAPDLLPFTE